jgi:autotransporter-associated beta strand protein
MDVARKSGVAIILSTVAGVSDGAIRYWGGGDGVGPWSRVYEPATPGLAGWGNAVPNAVRDVVILAALNPAMAVTTQDVATGVIVGRVELPDVGRSWTILPTSPITLDTGNSGFGPATILNRSYDQTLRIGPGRVIFNSDVVLQNAPDGGGDGENVILELDAALEGVGNVTVRNATSNERIALNGDNRFVGNIVVETGRLTVGHANALGAATNVVTLSSYSSQLYSSRPVGVVPQAIVATSSGLYDAKIGSTSTATDGRTEFSGPIRFNAGLTIRSQQTGAGRVVVSNTISGTGTVILNGPGVVELSGVNLYNGPTWVDAGTLMLNGVIARPIEVGSATLGGRGSGATVSTYGNTILSPGDVFGDLQVGLLTLDAGLRYNWQIADANGVAGEDYDLLVADRLDLTAVSTSVPVRINLWSLAGTEADGVLAVSGPAADFDPAAAASWTLFQTNGIIGFDPAKFRVVTAAADGTGGFANAFTGTFDVTLGAGGNDVLLRYTPVPEPTSVVSILAGAALLRRRR